MEQLKLEVEEGGVLVVVVGGIVVADAAMNVFVRKGPVGTGGRMGGGWSPTPGTTLVN